MFKYMPVITILAILLAGVVNAAETIKGHACYHYSDNESLNDARDIALSMAKREALESYSVFVESSSVVENHVLKNDLIASLSAAVLKNLKVIGKSLDTKNRKVCRTIQAKIEPVEVKKEIKQKINFYEINKGNFPTGLPETKYIKVLKATAAYPSKKKLTGLNVEEMAAEVGFNLNAAREAGANDDEIKRFLIESSLKSTLTIRGLCKKKHPYNRATLAAVTWYDKKEGLPTLTNSFQNECKYIGEVVRFENSIPPHHNEYGYNYNLQEIEKE